MTLRTADLVTGEVFGGEEFDLGDDDTFTGRADCTRIFVGDLIGGDKEGVGGGVEDACFMEEGGAVVFD